MKTVQLYYIHIQTHTSRKELHRWTRTNSSFIQTNNFSRNHFTAKTKKGRERERETKPNRADKSAQNKNIPLGLSIGGRNHRSGAGVRRRIYNTKPAATLLRSDDYTGTTGAQLKTVLFLWFLVIFQNRMYKIHS